MKTIQLKIELKNKKIKNYREIVVSKKTTYAQLHEIIQVVFNLDGVEAYGFKVNNKWIRLDIQDSVNKTLIRMKENDVFEYFYDLVETLYFKITVMKISENEKVPACIKAVGKCLNEKRIPSEFAKFDADWTQACLDAFDDECFEDKIKEELKRLVAVRYFQDFMHNQIMEIHLPQNRVVYMACDATEEVILNFHINERKIMEYLNLYHKAPMPSMIKYHDCIECSMFKANRYDDFYDFKVGNFVVLMTHANVFNESEEVMKMYRHYYVEALKRYVDAIEVCAKENIKFKEGMMLCVKDDIKQIPGQMTFYPVQYGMDRLVEVYRNQPSRESHVEVDVLTLMEDEKLHTLCVVGTKEDGFIEKELFNTSIKTMNQSIIQLLAERWQELGMDRTILLRDSNLKREMDEWLEPFGIETFYGNLKDIDEVYLKSEPNPLTEDDAKRMLRELLAEMGIDYDEFDQLELEVDEFGHVRKKNKKNYS